jgi:hypothetical protein
VTLPERAAAARRGRRRRRRRATIGRWAVRLAVVLLAFGVGVALGLALRDNPRPGGSSTLVRTLPPGRGLGPPSTVTVTVG